MSNGGARVLKRFSFRLRVAFEDPAGEPQEQEAHTNATPVASA